MTREDLEQIGKLIESKQEAERKYTRKIVQEVIDVNNKVFGTILRVELATTKREILEAVKVGFQDIIKHEKKQDDKIQDHDERINLLEHSEHPHKN